MIYQAKKTENLEEFILGLAHAPEDDELFIDNDNPSFIEDDEPWPWTGNNKLIEDEDEAFESDEE